MSKSANYWSKDVCGKEALNYNSRNEFKRGSPSAYNKAIKNNVKPRIFLTSIKKNNAGLSNKVH